MKIIYKNNEFIIKQHSINLYNFIKKFDDENRKNIIAFIFNNNILSFFDEIKGDGILKPINFEHPIARHIYRHTLTLILFAVFKELYPELKIDISGALENGFYFEITGWTEEKFEIDIKTIRQKIMEIIKEDIKIITSSLKKNDLKKIIDKKSLVLNGCCPYFSKIKKIRFLKFKSIIDFCNFVHLPSTGYIKNFEILKYKSGILLRFPSLETFKIPVMKRQNKLFNIFTETNHWYEILGLKNVYQLNKIIKSGKFDKIVKIAEALHEKKIAKIADEIKNKKNIRLILIAGPSSSGKTTFSKRLEIQLYVNGIKPFVISVDNYFVDREETPKDNEGNYDFEHIKAVDLALLNEHLLKLMQGKQIIMPEYSFASGEKKFNSKPISLKKNQIIIMEGLHCLNDDLTYSIPLTKKYKIYISALNQLRIDSMHRISTTDNRIIRRIIRDFKFRNYSVKDTLKRFSSIIKGENKWIFPFQEKANIMFNSSLLYELSVLQAYCLPLLKKISSDENIYPEAKRLENILQVFEKIPGKFVPANSILREFIGKSSFHY